MSRVTIDCPHCGAPTRIDLGADLTTQRCDRCDVRFSSVETGVDLGKRKRVWVDPTTGQPLEKSSWADDGERESAGSPLSARRMWVVGGIAALAAVGVVGWLVVQAMTPPEPKMVPAPVIPTGAKGGEPSNYDSMKLYFDKAIAGTKAVLAADTVDGLLTHVRERQSMEPIMRAYYAPGGEGEKTLPLGLVSIAPIDRHLWLQKLGIAVINYNAADGQMRAIAWVAEPDATLKFDWPSLVAYSELPVDRFLAEKPTQPKLLRLMGAFDDYYNKSFSSPADYICLKLRDLKSKFVFYGYAKRGTKAYELLKSAALPVRTRTQPLTIRASFPASPQSEDQVNIDEYLGTGWVVLPKKDDSDESKTASEAGKPHAETLKNPADPSDAPAPAPKTPVPRLDLSAPAQAPADPSASPLLTPPPTTPGAQ